MAEEKQMRGLLGLDPLSAVTANQGMLAQALKSRAKPPMQMQPLTTQGLLDGAALATSPVPILGDLVGLGADANRFYNEPESRTPLNFGLAALGLIPFAPPLMAAGLSRFAQSQGKSLSGIPSGPGMRQAGMITSEVGRIPETDAEARQLAEMLERAALKSGFNANVDSSAISPSKYVSLSGDGLPDMQVRLSNHADKYPELAFGKRISVDPTTGISFEQAVNELTSAGYKTPLSARYSHIPSWEEIYEKRRVGERLNNEALELARKQNFKPNFGDMKIERRQVGADKRWAYRITNPDGSFKNIMSSDVPEAIKANPDRNILFEYVSKL